MVSKILAKSVAIAVALMFLVFLGVPEVDAQRGGGGRGGGGGRRFLRRARRRRRQLLGGWRF